ncbi:MAG: ABC transporter substrate-binding protein [Acidimicrobiales bacterium]
MASHDPELSRRTFLRRAAAVGVALPALPVLLDACGKSGKSASSTTTLTPQKSANQTLVIGDTTDNNVATGPKSYLGMYPTNANVYEPLVALQPDYSIAPGLASSWEQTGANTFRFHLRPGVTFHDGSPFTADDVVWSITRIANGGGGNIGVSTTSAIKVDAMTVDITPTKSDLRVVEQLVHPEWSILKNNTMPGPTGPGTGPFKWGEYVAQDHLTVMRNDSYWGTKAQASQLTFKFIPDDNSRSLALQGGQLDICRDVARPSVTDLQKQAGIKILKAPVGLYNALYLNIHGKAPYTLCADPAVRMAIQTGLDRAGLIASVFGGLAVASQTLLPASLLGPAASMVQGFSYDQNAAKSALDAAGWTATSGGTRSKNGTALSLTLVNGFPDSNSNAGIPEFVQGSLRNIGIDVKITTEPDSASYSAALAAGSGDMFLEIGSQNDANPAFLPEILFYTANNGTYGKLFGPGASVDTLITMALADTSETQVKQDTAAALHQIVDVSQVLCQTAGLFRIIGTKSTIAGLVPHASDVNQLWSSVFRTA